MKEPVSRRLSLGVVDRVGPSLVTAAAFMIVAARLWLVFYRLIDPDEFQHLHAGYSVWQGLVPYRDFFEQHEPVLWYLSLPFFFVWGPSLRVLFAGRFVVWLVGVVTVVLVLQLGRQFFGRWAGPIAALLLAMHPPFQEKNVEWRPDNLALPLLLGAVWCLDRSAGRRGVWWASLAGLQLAGAFLCTQKVVYVAAGMVVGACWVMVSGSEGGRRQRWLRAAGLAAAGAFSAISLAAAVLGFFHCYGAADEFVQLTLVAPVQWKTDEPLLRYAVNQLITGPIFWSAGLAGWIATMTGVWLGRERSAGVAAMVGGACVHLLGLLHVPAAFHQYYLPVSPLVALLAARTLCTVAGWCPEPPSRSVRLIATVAAVSLITVSLVLRRMDAYFSSGWLIAIALLLVVSAVAGLRYRRLSVFILLGVSVVAALPFHHIHYVAWRHVGQTRVVERLLAATEPGDAFFDGFTGYGALRPHAFYFYWINHHSWPMISDADRTSGVIAALQDPGTRVVLFDENLARFLPIEARRTIQQHFEPDMRYSDYPVVVVYARRDRPLPEPNQSSQ